MPDLGLKHCHISVEVFSSDPKWQYYAEKGPIELHELVVKRNDLVSAMNKHLFACAESNAVPDDLRCKITELWSRHP